MRAMLRRGRFWRLTMATGGSLFVLGGCDPAVRDTMLAGVEQAATSLAGTFIQAFIESLKNEGQDDTATTVQVFKQYVPQVFA